MKSFRYHDLDDEPTCRKFDCDLESIPMEREILREHILQEIQHYHSKRAKPNLTPIQTNLFKSFQQSQPQQQQQQQQPQSTITTATTTSIDAITTKAAPVVRFDESAQKVSGA